MDDIARLLGSKWGMTQFKNGPATNLFTARRRADIRAKVAS
jgi:hypothetical protein